MALSLERARQHVQDWSERLRRSPGCDLWPLYLFHTAHVTTAVSILRSGRLSCRSRVGQVEHDVANQGALHNNPHAHDFARLYFRPKTMFHLKTEGIKCLDDPYRDRFQMSVPVLLAFDSLSVLTHPLVGFSRGKLSKIREIGQDGSFFDSIPFDQVFHDGPPADPAQMEEIQDRRMAEVVVRHEFALFPHLKKIFCRTPLERRTLLHLLGENAARFRNLATVEPWLFLRQALFLTRAESGPQGLRLTWHPPRRAPATGEISIRLTHHAEGEIPDVHTLRVPVALGQAVVTNLVTGVGGTWEIQMEDVLAFHAPIPTATSVLLR